MRIAITGTSGSGKTTLAKWISENYKIPFISSSSGDILTSHDRSALRLIFGISDGGGHEEVIKNSIKDPEYAIALQWMLLKRRGELILKHKNFIIDRSPLDNITYMINQCGFLKNVTQKVVELFIDEAKEYWKELDYVIYVKTVQLDKLIEDNGSRIPNWYYQKSIDCQFENWLILLMQKTTPLLKPLVLVIDYWTWEKRIEAMKSFINP